MIQQISKRVINFRVVPSVMADNKTSYLRIAGYTAAGVLSLYLLKEAKANTDVIAENIKDPSPIVLQQDDTKANLNHIIEFTKNTGRKEAMLINGEIIHGVYESDSLDNYKTIYGPEFFAIFNKTKGNCFVYVEIGKADGVSEYYSKLEKVKDETAAEIMNKAYKLLESEELNIEPDQEKYKEELRKVVADIEDYKKK